VATHYGFYNTVVGVGIMLGNLFTGTVFDLTRDGGWPELPGPGSPCSAPAACSGLHLLDRTGGCRVGAGVQ
jgi:hypothetical protein